MSTVEPTEMPEAEPEPSVIWNGIALAVAAVPAKAQPAIRGRRMRRSIEPSGEVVIDRAGFMPCSQSACEASTCEIIDRLETRSCKTPRREHGTFCKTRGPQLSVAFWRDRATATRLEAPARAAYRFGTLCQTTTVSQMSGPK